MQIVDKLSSKMVEYKKLLIVCPGICSLALGFVLVDLHLRTKAELYSFMQGSFVKLQDLICYVSKYMLNAT